MAIFRERRPRSVRPQRGHEERAPASAMNGLPPIVGGDRRLRLVRLIAAAFGQGATLVVSALAVREIVGALRDGGGEVPYGALAVLATAGLVLAALRYAEGVMAEHVGQSYIADMRQVLFLRLSTAPARWLAEQRSGALSLRYVGDLSALKNWAGTGLSRGISACVMLPAAFAVLAALDLRLALVAALPAAATLGLMVLLGPPLSAAHGELRRRRARMAAAMGERLQQASALRRSGRLRTEQRTLRTLSTRLAAAAAERAHLASALRAAPDAASGLAGAGCLWLCLHLGIGVAETVAALTTLAMIVRPLRHLVAIRDQWISWRVATARLARTLAAPEVAAIARPTRPARANAPALDARALDIAAGIRLTATLARGEIRRLVGSPGIGKSHLMMLAAGLEEPTGGRLRVLGRRPAELAPGEMLYLGGASPALCGSLRREVLLGTGRIPPDAEIVGTLAAVGLGPLAERLGGLDGRVDEGRRNLSASETARLLLARCLLARPGIVLVDADEVGFTAADLELLVEHLRAIGAAGLVAAARAPGSLHSLPCLRLGPSASAREHPQGSGSALVSA